MTQQNPILEIDTPRVFLPLLQPARYKGAFGGRGSGKSHFFAELAVETTAFQSKRILSVREIQKSLDQSAKMLIEDKIKKLGLQGYFKVRDSWIEGTRNDSLISFQGMQNHNADSVKSFEGYDVAWIEEAHRLSARSLSLLRPTIRKVGSEIWASWNPDKKTDPIDELLRGPNPPPNSIVVHANYYDNPFLPDVLQEEMEYDRSRDIEKFGNVWLGNYLTRSEARVFNNWSIAEFETPADARFYLGADWGFAIDPTVLIRCFIVGMTLYVDMEVYKIGCRIEDTPALFRAVDQSDMWPILADSARPETIDYMVRHGYPRMKAAKKGAGSIEEGIEFLKNYDIVVHPRCKHAIDELTFYSWKTDPLTGEILPILLDKKNNVIDALRYAVENLRRSSFTLDNVS